MEISLHRFDVLQTGATAQGSLKVCFEQSVITVTDQHGRTEAAAVCRSYLKVRIDNRSLLWAIPQGLYSACR